MITLTYSRFCVQRKIAKMDYPTILAEPFDLPTMATGLKASSVDETDVWEETSDETESNPASAERDRWRKRKIVMPSESPLAKTRPGLRVSWREHTVAIMQLRRRIYRRLFAHCISKTRPRSRFSLCNLPSKSLKVFKLLLRSQRMFARHRDIVFID